MGPHALAIIRLRLQSPGPINGIIHLQISLGIQKRVLVIQLYTYI